MGVGGFDALSGLVMVGSRVARGSETPGQPEHVQIKAGIGASETGVGHMLEAILQ